MSGKSTAAMLAMMDALRLAGPELYNPRALGPKVRKTKKKANASKVRAKAKAAKQARKRNRR